jgi:hypothetical protein
MKGFSVIIDAVGDIVDAMGGLKGIILLISTVLLNKF